MDFLLSVFFPLLFSPFWEVGFVCYYKNFNFQELLDLIQNESVG